MVVQVAFYADRGVGSLNHNAFAPVTFKEDGIAIQAKDNAMQNSFCHYPYPDSVVSDLLPID
jgi:hypothetical protein